MKKTVSFNSIKLMNKEYVTLSDQDILSFQKETNEVLREYCIVNIEESKKRIRQLEHEIGLLPPEQVASSIAKEKLDIALSELALYESELAFISDEDFLGKI